MKCLVFAAIVAIGCNSGGDAEAPPVTCAATEALLDGVCFASGVDACAEGFESDGVGGCKAILPDAPCTGATIATPGARACRPVGVEKCGEGFAADPSSQCTAMVAEDCLDGMYPVLGSGECKPVADCGETIWGPLPIDPNAIYVDAAFTKGGSDGSVARPFADLASALALVDASHKQLVLAEGTYDYGEVLEKSVEFRGRCPSRVSIRSVGGGLPVMKLSANVTFRAVSISGHDRGLQIESGTTKLVQTLVHDMGAEGIVLTSKAAAVELEDSVIDATTRYGIFADGGRVSLDRSVVRHTIAVDMDGGAGVWVQNKGQASVVGSLLLLNDRFGLVANASTVKIDRSAFLGNQVVGDDAAASLFSLGGSNTTITNSTFEGNSGVAVIAGDGVLTLENSVIASTSAVPGKAPTGLLAEVNPFDKKASTLVVKNCAIVANQGSGISIEGATATIDRTLFRDGIASDEDQSGEGIVSFAGTGDTPPDVTVRDSLIERATHAGIAVNHGKMLVERSVIREGVPSPSGKWGVGVAVYSNEPTANPLLELRGSLIERVHAAGVLSFGAEVVVDRTLIRDLLQQNSGDYGHGIHLTFDIRKRPAKGTITGSVIDGAFEVGITAFRSSVTVERTTVLHTHAGRTAAYGDGISVAGSQLDGREWSPASLVVRRSRIDGNARAGISVFEADATIEGVTLTCNAFPLNIESQNHAVNLTDGGANGCACGAPLDRCTASSANLRAVSAL